MRELLKYYGMFCTSVAGLAAVFCLQAGITVGDPKSNLEEVFELLKAEDAVPLAVNDAGRAEFKSAGRVNAVQDEKGKF
jgi:hypothetical protein